MEGLTIGQIAAAVGLTAALITGLGVIAKLAGKAASRWLSQSLEAISDKLDGIENQLGDFDRERCKDYLVSFIAKIDRGHKPSDTELERFFENYDRYTTHGGNSYVKTEVQRLMNSGKTKKSPD